MLLKLIQTLEKGRLSSLLLTGVYINAEMFTSEADFPVVSMQISVDDLMKS